MTATVPSSPARSRGAGLVRRRDVRLLLAGQATSELGSQVGSIALPLGGLLGGLAGERLGVHPTLWLVGFGLALTPLPLLASPLRRAASEVGGGRRQ